MLRNKEKIYYSDLNIKQVNKSLYLNKDKKIVFTNQKIFSCVLISDMFVYNYRYNFIETVNLVMSKHKYFIKYLQLINKT
jgi:hypothetical protein